MSASSGVTGEENPRRDQLSGITTQLVLCSLINQGTLFSSKAVLGRNFLSISGICDKILMIFRGVIIGTLDLPCSITGAWSISILGDLGLGVRLSTVKSRFAGMCFCDFEFCFLEPLPLDGTTAEEEKEGPSSDVTDSVGQLVGT